MSRWDAVPDGKAEDQAQPKRRSRWDDMASQPLSSGISQSVVQSNQTYSGEIGVFATPQATPLFQGKMGAELQTPGPLSPRRAAIEQAARSRWERELDERNRPLTDDEISAMLPESGYKILEVPGDYIPLITPARRLLATPSLSLAGDEFYSLPEEVSGLSTDIPSEVEGITIHPEEQETFKKILTTVDESTLKSEEMKEREFLTLILKVKNGTPQQRKTATRLITEKAKEFGADIILSNLLPMFMLKTLEEQERHLLVKILDRVLLKLDDAVRPYTHKILSVIEPLLIDKDYFARIEGREIIANLSKAVGLQTMIATMRPDIDSPDERIRNTTARAFAVTTVTFGINSMIPFIRAAFATRRSWEARQTAVRIVRHVAEFVGCGVLPYLGDLVKCIQAGVTDEAVQVRRFTALALSELAEACAPYGAHAFKDVALRVLESLQKEKSKTRVAFLKCAGSLVPLFEGKLALSYIKSLSKTLVEEFSSPDDEMRKTVMKVVQQCISSPVESEAILSNQLVPKFFESFWASRVTRDRMSANQLVATTAELAKKVGAPEVVTRLHGFLKEKDISLSMRAAQAILRIVKNNSLELLQNEAAQLVDSLLFAIQSSDNPIAAQSAYAGGDRELQNVFVTCFGAVGQALNVRFEPFITNIVAKIYHRINSKDANIRQQSADLIVALAPVLFACHDEDILNQLYQAMYECLGEEFPEVLGSILGALKSIVNTIGMRKLNPPVSDLLPRLTPILRNRHEKVQENCVDLVGRIAERAAEAVSPREWCRICFELVDIFRTPRRNIRQAAVNAFGFIAKAVDPQEVLSVLLKNLRVQERTNRVCTTIAIAIVADQCQPFVVLPLLMNEYKVPELNVQNGVLKSLSFLFEYIGETAKDYIYSITTLLENALVDRDLVHRQTAAATLKHLALGVFGLGKEDAILHLLNCLWPNIFETSPHVISAVFDAIDGCRVCLGPTRILQYTVQGLFHPARKVRDVYWRIYNMTYIGNQDALVPSYPTLENDGDRTYQRRELELLF
ncbi:putative Splicing factor 3B subunit 1 [Blattamonas nauphoetae]|uniref:Splicing factor 3B subunit 1 n=1 Tax=Blattamonas nauphoetae TaxID=2049346 RepID=A0ABQ9Y153_9EUKA|nr:putative Splicing factor 3B subunit 1 [Blattamonas nauphoetae]